MKPLILFYVILAFFFFDAVKPISMDPPPGYQKALDDTDSKDNFGKTASRVTSASTASASATPSPSPATPSPPQGAQPQASSSFRDSVQKPICGSVGTKLRDSNYANICSDKTRSGYVYQDPDPINLDGKTKEVTGWSAKSKSTTEEQGQCDHFMEVQWVHHRGLADMAEYLANKKAFGNIQDAEAAICKAFQGVDEADTAKQTKLVALQKVFNVADNLWGIPYTMNQLKQKSIRDIIEKKSYTWDVAAAYELRNPKFPPKFQGTNDNKAAQGLIPYLNDKQAKASDVADNFQKEFARLLIQAEPEAAAVMQTYPDKTWRGILEQDKATMTATFATQVVAAAQNARDKNCGANPNGQRVLTPPKKTDNGQCCPDNTVGVKNDKDFNKKWGEYWSKKRKLTCDADNQAPKCNTTIECCKGVNPNDIAGTSGTRRHLLSRPMFTRDDCTDGSGSAPPADDSKPSIPGDVPAAVPPGPPPVAVVGGVLVFIHDIWAAVIVATTVKQARDEQQSKIDDGIKNKFVPLAADPSHSDDCKAQRDNLEKVLHAINYSPSVPDCAVPIAAASSSSSSSSTSSPAPALTIAPNATSSALPTAPPSATPVPTMPLIPNRCEGKHNTYLPSGGFCP